VAVGEALGKVAYHLGDPHRGGVRGRAEDPDSPAGVFDHREDVHPGAAQRHRFEEVGGEDGFGLGAQEHCPTVRSPLGRWVDLRGLEDLPDGGRGDLDAQDEQFPVDAPVAPAAVVACQAQHQRADGPHRGWPTGAFGARQAGVTSGDQVAMPAQYRFRAHQKSDPMQHVAGESV
jgi:hypothetical protein